MKLPQVRVPKTVRQILVDDEKRHWAHELDSYYKFKTLRDKTEFHSIRASCQRQMARIKSNWPNNAEAFKE